MTNSIHGIECGWVKMSGKHIRNVLATNGKDSKLYDSILEHISSLPEVEKAVLRDSFQSWEAEGIVNSLDYDKNIAHAIWSQTHSPKFKEWFGDSKVVDENGEPLLVYHGSTVKGIREFEAKYPAKNADILGTKAGLFFTDHEPYAKEVKQNDTVYPVFLHMDNPDLEDREEIDHITAEQSSERGYDGLIGTDYGQTEGKTYVVFDKNQIKSLFNQGGYSKEKGEYDTSINYQTERIANADYEDFSKRKVALEAKGAKDVQLQGTLHEGTIRYIADPNNIYFQKSNEKTLPSKANPATVAEYEEFLKRKGVPIITTGILDKDGKPIPAKNAVDLAQNLVYIVDGEKPTALGEETFHYGSRIIQAHDPKLWKEMMNRVGNYKLYGDIVDLYKNDKKYQNPDGSINIPKMKEETIGRLLHEHYVQEREGLTEKPELLEQLQGWWKKFVEGLKSFFSGTGYDPFRKAAKQFARDRGAFKTDRKIHEAVHKLTDQSEKESYSNFKDRTISSLKDIASKVKDKTVVVTHGTVLNMARSWKENMYNDNISEDSYNKKETENGHVLELQVGDKTLYLVRHGESTANVLEEPSTDETPLTGKGQEDAVMAAQELKEKGVTEVLNTDTERTDHTAAIIRKELQGEDTFLQKKEETGEEKRDNAFDKITEVGSKVVRPTEPGKKYTYAGAEVPTRVHDKIAAEQKKKMGKMTFSSKEEEEKYTKHTEKAIQLGTDISSDLDQIVSEVVDKSTGLKRDRIEEDHGYIPITDKYQSDMDKAVNGSIYDNLKLMIRGWDEPNKADIHNPIHHNGILDLYPEGTKFIWDVPLYDPNAAFQGKSGMAGTPDFIAITPDGIAHLHDWKSVGRTGEIKGYTKEAYNLQMKAYAKMLKDAYGVEVQTARMDIMGVKWGEGDSVKGVNIHGIDLSMSAGELYRPYLTDIHKTGDKVIDDYADRLIGMLNALQAKDMSDAERVTRSRRAADLEKAILRLRLEKSFAPIMEQGDQFIKYADREQARIASSNVDFSNMDMKEFSKEAGNLIVLKDNLQIYKDLSKFKGYMQDADKLQALEQLITKAENLYNKQIEMNMKVASEWFKDKTIDDIAKAQKQYGAIAGTVRERSNQELTTVQGMQDVLQNLSNRSQNRINDTLYDFTNDIGTGIYDEVSKWGDEKKLWSVIGAKDKNKLISPFKSEFYEELDKAKEAKDIQWVKDHTDNKALEDYLNKKRESQLRDLYEYYHLASQGMTMDKPWEWGRGVDTKLEESVERILKYTEHAGKEGNQNWYSNAHKFPKKLNADGSYTKWVSEEMKNLERPGNAPAKKFYDYIQKWNNQFATSGYLQWEGARTFLPHVPKETVTKIFSGGFNIKDGLLSLYTSKVIEDRDPLRDPRTGEIINSLPKSFQSRLSEKEVSKDLIKNQFLHIMKGIEWEEKNAVEDIIYLLQDIERSKGMLELTQKGMVTGKVIGIGEKTDNVKLLNDFIDTGFYKIHDLGNDAQFGKVKMTSDGKEVRASGSKMLSTVTGAASGAILSWKLSIMGFRSLEVTLQSLYNANKYFSAKTQSQGLYDFIGSRAFKGSNELTIGLLKSFLPEEEQLHIAAKGLSLNKLNNLNVQEFLMKGVKSAHNIVVYSNFFAHMESAIVIDGKIHNVREYYRSLPESANRYKDITKYEKELPTKCKELLDKYGLMKFAKYNKETGKMDYPGLDLNDRSVAAFKQLIRVTGREMSGNISHEDQSRMRSNVWWRQMLMYNNWLPRQWDVRAGNLAYNKGKDSYEWGRTRVFAQVVFAEGFLPAATKILKTLVGMDEVTRGTEKGLGQLQEMYNKTVEDQLKKGVELKMTKEEFYDLVRDKVKNQVREFQVVLAVCAAYWGLMAMLPKKGDDDYEETVAQFGLLKKIMLKVKEAMSSYYNPSSFLEFGGGTKFPVVSYIKDAVTATESTLGSIWGMSASAAGWDEYGDNIIHKNHVIKDWGKLFPILRAGEQEILPILDKDMADYLGIKSYQGQAFSK